MHKLITRNANASVCLCVTFSKKKFAPTDERQLSLRSLKAITGSHLIWSFSKCNYQSLLKTKQASCPSCPRTSLLQSAVSRVIYTSRYCAKLWGFFFLSLPWLVIGPISPCVGIFKEVLTGNTSLLYV